MQKVDADGDGTLSWEEFQALTAPPVAAFTVERNVVYGTCTTASGREDLRCDVFHPGPDAAPFKALPEGQRVGVLLIHGGAWLHGEKDQLTAYGLCACAHARSTACLWRGPRRTARRARPRIRAVLHLPSLPPSAAARRLAREGYVCVCNGYRLALQPQSRDTYVEGRWSAPKGLWPAMLYDCKACVRWMRANAASLGISPDHIAVTGNSAGGHLSLMVAGVDGDLYPHLEGDSGSPGVSSKVQACCAVYPPTRASLNHRGQDKPARGLSAMVARSIIGRDGATARAMAEFSPMSYASGDFPPTCLLHGNGDTLVSAQDSVRMYEELNACGAHAELHMFASGPHGFDFDPRIGR